MNTLFLLIGIATTYAGPYVGRPLYCDRDGTLLYTLPSKSRPSPSGRATASTRGGGAGGEVWVALDVRQFQTDAARCGDHVVLLFSPSTGGQEGGLILHAQALDAGPFRDYYVADYPALPIVADVPAHLWPVAGLSAPVHLLNLSALDRAMESAHVHLLP
jgi:hypothetical protein